MRQELRHLSAGCDGSRMEVPTRLLLACQTRFSSLELFPHFLSDLALAARPAHGPHGPNDASLGSRAAHLARRMHILFRMSLGPWLGMIKPGCVIVRLRFRYHNRTRAPLSSAEARPELCGCARAARLSPPPSPPCPLSPVPRRPPPVPSGARCPRTLTLDPLITPHDRSLSLTSVCSDLLRVTCL